MIDFAGLSEIGPIREDNQDSLYLPDSSHPAEFSPVFALADGMGGYSQGGVASNLALKALLDTFHSQAARKPAGALKRGIEAANTAVCAEANRLHVNRMGTTLTAAVIQGNTLFVAHVGDTRAYLVRKGQATCLTQDHTVVGDLLRMRVIKDEQVRDHARRSILTRAIGMSLFVQPDVFSINLQPDDRLVLCSDGCWAVVEDHEFASLTSCAGDAEEICRTLVDCALEKNSDDNISVIAVHIKQLSRQPAGVPQNEKVKQGWLSRLFGPR